MPLIFNGATGLFPITGRIEEAKEEDAPRLHRSRPVDQQALLLLILLAPTDLRVESRTTTTTYIIWAHPSGGSQLVELDRALGDGAFSNIAILPGGASDYTDTERAEGTRYRYRVRLV